MRQLLRSIGLTMSITACCSLYLKAQMKGDPAVPSSSLQQLIPEKTGSKLSIDLQLLSQEKVSALSRAQSAKPAIPGGGASKYIQRKGDKVVVDVTIIENDSKARAELEKMGMQIKGSYGRVVSGLIPVSSLPQLESSAYVKFARPAYKPMLLKHQANNSSQYSFYNGGDKDKEKDNKIKTVISQGDTAQRSYLARKLSKVDGKGTKVGVLSDSYDNLMTAEIGVKKGELPGKGNPLGFKKPVQVLEDLDDMTGSDEGRAMAEIVHDVAPGAELAFHTAFLGQADFAEGILQLADAGCNVVVDDIIYYAEPFFQDGIIAQAVNEAKKRGVTYFSSAGNQGVGSYESDYRSTLVEPLGPGSGTAHNFSAPGAIPRYLQPIYIPVGGYYLNDFQWSQSSFSSSGVGAETDFDIYLVDLDGNIVSGSASDNIASGEPMEIFDFFNSTPNYTFFLLIVKYAGPDVKRLKYISYADGQFYLTNPAIPGILAPTLTGHAKAEGAIATGAAFYLRTPAYGLDTPRVESYSSVGGVANYFDIYGNPIAPVILKKPEITAPDGANTSFFDPFGDGDISQDSDTYPNFFGTSAAAPHAAGVAALMIEAQKLRTITPAQIKGILSDNTYDMDNINTTGFDVGFDFNTGYGLIKADKAVAAVDFPKLFVKNLSLKAICSNDPDHTRNWEIKNPNPFELETHWSIVGFSEGKLVAPPGVSTFSTTTGTFRGKPVANIGVIDWKDNFGFSRIDLAYSTQAKCSTGERVSVENSDERLTTAAVAEAVTAKPDILEVYPNPSVSNFTLYVSLSNLQSINLEIFNVEGKKVYERRNAPSNGVITIDASRFGSGVYVLKASQGSYNKIMKLVKQ